MQKDTERSFDGGRCPPSEDVIAAVLDPAAGPNAEQLRRHLAQCAACRALVEDGRAVVGRLRREGAVAPRPDLVPGVLARIPDQAWRVSGRRTLALGRVYRFPVRLPVGIAAAALLVLGAALALRHAASRATQAATVALAQTGAVDSGLDWILARQKPSGGWDAKALGGAPEYAPALDGLAVLALTRAGDARSVLHTPLARAASALIGRQTGDGCIGQDFDGTMYNHGIATLALLEIYRATGEARLRDPIAKALAFIRERQSPAGGWGYRNGRDALPNTSITAWQVQSLLLADRLGWQTNRIAVRKAMAWLAGTVNGNGYFGYERAQQFPEGPKTLTMMGAYCLLAARRLDIPVDPALLARVTRGIGELAGEKPTDYYGAFFYSSALTVADPVAFGDALAAAGSSLVAGQRATGDERGTWPADDRWGRAGGRLYSTSMALLALASPQANDPAL
jgi:hypothetical protein